MDLVWLILGLALLVGAGDLLVRGAVALSLRLGIPALIISATVVAFGTSAPELLISVQAVLEDVPGIALGNVVGSNIANVLLVLGLPALLVPLAPCDTDAHRNLLFMVISTIVFGAMLLTGTITFWMGVVLLVITAVMVGDSVREGWRAVARGEEVEELAELEDIDPEMAGWKIALFIVAGIIGLPLGSDLLIDGARSIAVTLGVSETVIGLTLVAIGTSLPELATTIMAAIRRHSDVAIGNVLGSNIFNITAIIGAAALVGDLPVPAEILWRDLWWMVGASALLVPFILCRWRIARLAGLGFLVAYAVYLWLTFQ